MCSAAIVWDELNRSQQFSSHLTAGPPWRNRASVPTRDVQVYSEQQSTPDNEQSPFGHWSGISEGDSAFDWSMEAGTSSAPCPLDKPAGQTDKVKAKLHTPGQTANTQPEVSVSRESRPGEAGTLDLNVPNIVDLDSSLDDESQSSALTGLDLAEEERRIRYFKAMDLSLERRFSDVVQLYSSLELDSDDDGDFHERLITPGALEVPNAWLVRTPQDAVAKKLPPPSSQSLSPSKLEPSSPAVSFSSGLATPRMPRPVNRTDTPQISTSDARPQTALVSSIRPISPKPDRKDLHTSRMQPAATGISDIQVHSARAPQRSPIMEDFPTNVFGRRYPHTSTTDQEEHARAQVLNSTDPASGEMPGEATRQPVLSPHGLGIVCIDRDTRSKGRFQTGRPTLARSSTEPALAYHQSYPHSTTSKQSNNQHISLQRSPTVEAGTNQDASLTPFDLNGSVGMIDISVYTTAISLPPLPKSARRPSIVLPPNAIKVTTNPFSPKDREAIANGDTDRQIWARKKQEASRRSPASHSSQNEYPQITSKPVASSPSRSRSQRTRRFALHPGHPYAPQAECFASTLSEGLLMSEPSLKQDLSTRRREDWSPSIDKVWPPHLNNQPSDEPLQMPASGASKYSRPRMPHRHHTDTAGFSSLP